MSSFASGGLRHFRCQRQMTRLQWTKMAPSRRDASITGAAPSFSTTASRRAESHDELQKKLATNTQKALEESIIPFQGVSHARAVPSTPSYFSRDPQFNDMYIRAAKLLTKYHHLPTQAPGESQQVLWRRIEDMRNQLGENIKASHFSKVMRVIKRLQLIEPSVRPVEVQTTIDEFKRSAETLNNRPNPTVIDRYGRAIGVGRRKASSARAYVLEGTGEIQINGQPLSEAFGRVHDRESAVWALMATERLDKYNVWAVVKGGGKTGQAEALTLAVAKALIAHEPALKPALRKAGCITRDKRVVERKKHGKKGARAGFTWVKR